VLPASGGPGQGCLTKNAICRMLNHFQFLDSGRDGRKGIIFSRFAGPGSQRYPVGFSGDTIVSWASLEFQPEFTATASNIGYGWWSHDIGGHMGGGRSDELVTRWVQYGVFSPIFRLHSTQR
jgi:alpha-glucosidase (family GH31 glycosyl hydrolase)